jgi:hypothetical protein
MKRNPRRMHYTRIEPLPSQTGCAKSRGVLQVCASLPYVVVPFSGKMDGTEIVRDGIVPLMHNCGMPQNYAATSRHVAWAGCGRACRDCIHPGRTSLLHTIPHQLALGHALCSHPRAAARTTASIARPPPAGSPASISTPSSRRPLATGGLGPNQRCPTSVGQRHGR